MSKPSPRGRLKANAVVCERLINSPSTRKGLNNLPSPITQTMNSKRILARWSAVTATLLAITTASFAADTDTDGLDDSAETNTGVYVSPANTGTNPNNADTDGDGVPDGLEVKEKTIPVDATKFNSFSKGMIAFWPFNGNAKDETGRGYNGVVSNVTPVADRNASAASAFQFNGSSSTIRVASSITVNKDLTISYWAKFTPPASGAPSWSIMHRDGWQNGYVHYGLDSASISCGVAADSPQGYQIQPYASQQWNGGDWNHVVFVRDGTAMKYYFYINGVLFGQQSQSYLHTPTSVAPLQIGAWKGFSGTLERFFEGWLDDLRIYDRALSQAEVEAMNHTERGQAIVTIAVTSNGSITGSGEYDPGTPATLTATPNPGYRFTGWTGDATGTDNPLSILMDADKTVGASFTPDTNDTDDDGWTNYEEIVTHGTDPALPDTDGDNVKDSMDAFPLDPSETLDTDRDGIGDNADLEDDGDGLPDVDELTVYGTNPKRADSDGDGLNDKAEIEIHLTNPMDSDHDDDGLTDGAEFLVHHTGLKDADSDDDGFLDGYEVLTGKLPLDPLSKPALVAEARTAIEFTFSSALGKTYRIESSTDLVAWTVVESGIAGNGGQITRFYTTRNLPKRYFRVEEDAP